jgi:hypothetical protein
LRIAVGAESLCREMEKSMAESEVITIGSKAPEFCQVLQVVDFNRCLTPL